MTRTLPVLTALGATLLAAACSSAPTPSTAKLPSTAPTASTGATATNPTATPSAAGTPVVGKGGTLHLDLTAITATGLTLPGDAFDAETAVVAPSYMSTNYQFTKANPQRTFTLNIGQYATVSAGGALNADGKTGNYCWLQYAQSDNGTPVKTTLWQSSAGTITVTSVDGGKLAFTVKDVVLAPQSVAGGNSLAATGNFTVNGTGSIDGYVAH